MDGLFGIIVLAYVIYSLSNKNKAKTKKTFTHTMSGQHPYKNPLTEKQVQAPVVTADKQRQEEVSNSFMSTENQSIFQPVRHEMTSRLESVFRGSIEEETYEGTASSEGTDPCHDDMDTQYRQYGDYVPEASVSGLNLTFTKDSMLQAIVMSEVLTRPCDRKRRGIR